ncbi:MAG: ATP-grasp domain-containing protein [Candidatus Magasanikbacteria bacterium]
MHIGLTFNLRSSVVEEDQKDISSLEEAEFDSPATIDALFNTIEKLGHTVERIGNFFELQKKLVDGRCWDLVFNIAEGENGRNREAQIPAVLEAYHIPYTFSDPLTLAVSLDKSVAKRIIRDAGIKTPGFYTIKSYEDLQKLDTLLLLFPLFVKPNSEGTGKGVNPHSIVHNQDELTKVTQELLSTYKQPVLVEEFLPGREFTVGVWGTGEKARAISVLEIKLLENAEKDVYSFVNKELCEELVKYELVTDQEIVKDAFDIAVKAYQALECRDAGRVDIKMDRDGRLQFLEINPLAGLNPTHSDLPMACTAVGISYEELIRKIIDSACERM